MFAYNIFMVFYHWTTISWASLMELVLFEMMPTSLWYWWEHQGGYAITDSISSFQSFIKDVFANINQFSLVVLLCFALFVWGFVYKKDDPSTLFFIKEKLLMKLCSQQARLIETQSGSWIRGLRNKYYSQPFHYTK